MSKPSNRAIDFDVAHALVNYVYRKGETIELDGRDGRTTLYDIRCKLCELKRADSTVCLCTLNEWLSDQNDHRSYRKPTGQSIEHLMQLIRRAGFHYGKHPYRDYIRKVQRRTECGVNRFRNTNMMAEAAHKTNFFNLDRVKPSNPSVRRPSVARSYPPNIDEIILSRRKLMQPTEEEEEEALQKDWDSLRSNGTIRHLNQYVQDKSTPDLARYEEDFNAFTRMQKLGLWLRMKADQLSG